MAGVNYSLCTEPAKFEIHTDIVRGNVGMIYDTEVITCGSEAEWSGEARIYSLGTAFVQECRSLYDGEASRKEWRGKWCQSANTTPVTEITKWLDQVVSGAGYYSEAPIVPAEQNAILAGVVGEHYAIELQDQPINWAALCDAHPDILFGGDEFLGVFTTGTVTLYFSTDDYSLTAILIESMTDNSWMETSILTAKVEEGPNVDLTELVVGEGTLSEEWNMAAGNE